MRLKRICKPLDQYSLCKDCKTPLGFMEQLRNIPEYYISGLYFNILLYFNIYAFIFYGRSTTWFFENGVQF